MRHKKYLMLLLGAALMLAHVPVWAEDELSIDQVMEQLQDAWSAN